MTLFFGKPDESNLGYLRYTLLLFEAISGLKVNFAKGVLIPIREVPNVHLLAQFFGCGIDSLPSSYLGLPPGASYKYKAKWDPVVEKFQRKLVGWKSKLLSSGMIIHAHISSQLEKIMRDFHWSNNEVEMGFHWSTGMMFAIQSIKVG